MRIAGIIILFCFNVVNGLAQSAALQKQVDASITKNYPSLEKLYVDLHSNPELSQKEERTSGIIAKELKLLGFNVYEKIGGFGVGAVLKNGNGPTVLIRTDMDALPIEEKTDLTFASKARSTNAAGTDVPVMHACGHDLHMTVFIGAARALVETKKFWSGTLVMIAQPSEENGIGARAMINDKLYDKVPYPDFALALHNHAGMKAGTVGYSMGAFMASVDMMDITVFGKGGHGAAPHQTIDPIVLSAEMILAFQTIVSREINPIEPSVITVGSIHGGTVYNIIPDQVKLQLTLRSYSDEVRKQVIASIQNKSKFLARQAGLPEDKTPLITWNDSAPATVNDKALTQKLVTVFTAAFGQTNVLEMSPSMIGEDFSRFARARKAIPYSMFWLGTVNPVVFEKSKREGTPLPSLHAATFQPDPDPSIRTGIKAMTLGAIELLKN
ncbi:MAG TPA: amidohydrolase [Chryseosolibacter sp.]